jgi:energy-coupling factor transporter ATP-binding protein EcfA2
VFRVRTAADPATRRIAGSSKASFRSVIGRLVLFAGRAAVGKSTLSASLAQVLPEATLVPEMVFFEWPELEDIGDAFRRKDYPSAELLLDGWSRLLRTVRGAPWIVHDGCWVPLGEDLPWASWDAIVEFTRRTFEIAAPYDPVVFFLHGDEEQIRPRIEARGWADSPSSDGQEWADKLHRILTTAGVEITDLDASRAPDAVLRDALAVLAAV